MREEFLPYKFKIENLLKDLERHIKLNIKKYYKFELGDVVVDVTNDNKYKILEIKVDTSNFYGGDVKIYSKLENLIDGSIMYDLAIFNRLCTLKDYQTKNENYIKCLEDIKQGSL